MTNVTNAKETPLHWALKNEPVELITVAQLDGSDRQNLQLVLDALASEDIAIHVTGGVWGVYVGVPRIDSRRAIDALARVQLETKNRCVVRLINESGEPVDVDR